MCIRDSPVHHRRSLSAHAPEAKACAEVEVEFRHTFAVEHDARRSPIWHAWLPAPRQIPM
eukprot:3224722-Prymnesium_polylepis.1